MKKVIVYDLYVDIEKKNSWVNRYLRGNLKILNKFEKLVREKEAEYKLKTGWTYQFLAEQKIKLAAGVISAPLDPATGSLSLEEKRAFREQYPDLGEGLMVKCLTCLLVNESEKNKEYWFKMNGLDYGTLIGANYDQIDSLVQEILSRMGKLSEYYFKMGMDPVFYTVLEEQEGGKVIKTLDGALDDDGSVEFLEKEFGIQDLRENQETLMELIAEGFPITRGLTAEERKEFEALFF